MTLNHRDDIISVPLSIIKTSSIQGGNILVFSKNCHEVLFSFLSIVGGFSGEWGATKVGNRLQIAGDMTEIALLEHDFCESVQLYSRL